MPTQNLVLAAIIIGGVAGAAHLLDLNTSFPFGRREFTSSAGRQWPGGFALWLPPVWIVMLLSARGTAQLLLQPWRASRHYGYWLLAVSAALATLNQAVFDLLVTQVAHWWRWTSANLNWEGVALPNLAGSFVVSVIALLLATPALIDKRPVQSPQGLQPLGVWFVSNAVCLAVCVSYASDAVVAVLAAPVLAVTLLAFQRHRRAIAHCGAPADRK